MKSVKTARIQLVLVCVALASLLGCTEDSNDKTARQFQKKTTETLGQFATSRDRQTTSQQLEQALPRGRANSLSENSALLAAADMRLANTQQDWTSLQVQASQLSKSITSFNLALDQLSDNVSQNQRIRSLLDLSNTEIAEIEKWIGSDPNTASLKGQIAQAQVKEKELLDKKNRLEKDFQTARDTMLDLDTQAEEKLRQAQTASANKQADLEKAGFDLKNQKKEYYIKVQHAENLLADVNSELGIIQPHLKRLQDNLHISQEKLKAIQTSPARENLLKQHQELDEEIGSQKDAVKKQLEQILSQIAQHNLKTDEIVSTIETILEKYRNVNDRRLEPNLSMARGQATVVAGMATASKIYLTTDLALQLEAVLRTFETILPSGTTASISSQPDAKIAKKAMDYFDQATQYYQGAGENTSQLRPDAKQQAACSALKGQLLALKAKISLAEKIADFASAEKTQTQIDELLEKGKEYGVTFSQSATVLITTGINYIPTLPVDSSMVLEGIKKDFTNWRKLRGTEAEMEVDRLIIRIQQLRQDYPTDEQIAQFLNQEQQAIDQAKARGFSEETAPTDANSA